MEDVKALIVKNDLELSPEAQNRLLTQFQHKSISYLSPEKEAAPFMFYCLGNDMEKIALKTNYPPEVIMLTAMYYRWPEKKVVLQREQIDMVPAELQKDLTNSLLVATVIEVQKQLADVAAGRKSAKDCPLIPTSMLEMEKLVGLVERVNKLKGTGPAVPGNNVIRAENVQINQNQQIPAGKGEPAKSSRKPEKTEDERAKMLSAMEDE